MWKKELCHYSFLSSLSGPACPTDKGRYNQSRSRTSWQNGAPIPPPVAITPSRVPPLGLRLYFSKSTLISYGIVPKRATFTLCLKYPLFFIFKFLLRVAELYRRATSTAYSIAKSNALLCSVKIIDYYICLCSVKHIGNAAFIDRYGDVKDIIC